MIGVLYGDQGFFSALDEIDSWFKFLHREGNRLIHLKDRRVD